jgi:uncharacterized protein (TIGR03118 family)
MPHSTRNLQHTVLEGKHKRPSRERRPAVEGLEERALLSAAHDLAVHKHFAVPPQPAHKHFGVPPQPVSGFKQTNLVSDIPGKAQLYDPSLVNPWDINFPQLPGIDPPVWVADQGTGVATMYQITNHGSTVTKSSLTVTIPTFPQSISTQTGPTGVVYDPLKKFSMPGPGGASVPAIYIFDTLQGTIEGYNPVPHKNNSSAEILVIPTPYTTVYTGLAAGTVGSTHYIYAANDIASPGIDVYNGSFVRVTLRGGNFVDPDLPPRFTPYGVHDLGNHLYVTYRGPEWQGGAVAEFSNDGRFMRQIASNGASGPLQSPWGAAEFSKTSKDLFVGNYSSGQIDRYNQAGVFKGMLTDSNGNPLTIPGLRTIHFGSGLGASGPKIALLFTAGIDNENNGLYGTITPVT